MLTLYRVFMIGLIALAVFGIAQLAYTYHVDIKQSEAVVLSRGIAECLFGNGVLYLDRISEGERRAILSYCGYGEVRDLERYYVSVRILERGTDEEVHLQQGDSGKGWVRKLIEATGLSGSVERYVPGKHSERYSVLLEKEGKQTERDINIEVIVGEV